MCNTPLFTRRSDFRILAVEDPLVTNDPLALVESESGSPAAEM
jgi:hypothetical protein